MRHLLLMTALAGCQAPVTAQSYLAVLHIAPSHGSAEIAVDVKIAATFSEPLVEASVSEESAWIEDKDGEPINSAVSYNPETWTISIDPDSHLGQEANYVVLLSTDIVGEDSGALLQVIESGFRTGGPVEVSNDLPVAEAGADQNVQVGDLVSLDGTGSSDPEGEPLSHTWAFLTTPDGSEAELDSDQVSKPEFTPDVEGLYTLSLVVNDGTDDSSADYVEITAEASDTGS